MIGRMRGVRWDRAPLVGLLALAGCGGEPAVAIDASVAIDAPVAIDARVADAGANEAVTLTWIGVSTWLVRYGDDAVLLDAYLSRAPFGELGGDAAGEALLAEVLADAGAATLDAALIGHSHFDHAFDVGAAARAGAVIYGSATTCHLASAQGVGAGGCIVVGGGDSFAVGALAVRVLRVPHSLPASLGSYEELDAPPPTPITETSVPVGAQLAYHVEVSGRPGLSLLFYDSFAPLDADDGAGEDFAGNLAAAYPGAAGATAWLVGVFGGIAGAGTSQQDVADYLAVVRPQAIIAQHWDDLGTDPRDGLASSFSAPASWSGAAASAAAELVAPSAYFERFELDASGIRRMP